MTQDELKTVLADHALWLADSEKGQRAILTGADLHGADLTGADLRKATLIGTDLRNAILNGADLRDADLRSVRLINADLRDADLRGATIFKDWELTRVCSHASGDEKQQGR